MSQFTQYRQCSRLLILLFFALALFKAEAQDISDNGSTSGKLWKFITKPQREFRQERPLYVGATLQGVQLGYHFRKKLSFNLSYTPKNHFTKKDGLEVGGISEGLGFTDGAGDNTIFDITGVEDYENIDKHLIILDARYFVWQSLFVSVGYGFATGSQRTVFFTEEDRTLGNSFYNDLDVTVRVNLKNAHSINLGVGFHHFFGPVGIGFSGVFGLYPRTLRNSIITTNQTIQQADLDILESTVRKEVRRENYGYYQFLMSISFRLK